MSEEIRYEPVPWGRIFITGIIAVIVSLGLGAYLYSSIITTEPNLEETIAILEEQAVVPDLTVEELRVIAFMDYNDIVMDETQQQLQKEFGGDLNIIGIRGPGIFDVYIESLQSCQVMGTINIDSLWLTFSLGLLDPNIVCLDAIQ